MTKAAAFIAACLIMISCIVTPITAYADSYDTASQLLGGICDNKSSGGSIQAWIDGELTDKAGVSSEWYVMALSQSGSYDFSRYQKALKSYIANNNIASATTREKLALALISTGSSDSYITEALGSSAGKQGLMSLVFALHIVNNGFTTGDITAKSLISDILALQKADGGFAIIGDYGDPDCTAMTVTALAPSVRSNSKVKAACDKALGFLSKAQQASGAYKSFGVENCESTVQVLLALSSLGIDPCKDERFIKGGSTIIDAIAGFALSDGSFEHQKGKGANESATVQAFYCLTAYERMGKGKGAFFVFDNKKPPKTEKPQDTDKPKVTTKATTAKAPAEVTTKKAATKKQTGTTAAGTKQTASQTVTSQSAGGNVTTRESEASSPGRQTGSKAKTTTKSTADTTANKTDSKTESVTESVTDSESTTTSQQTETVSDTAAASEADKQTTTAVTERMVDEIYHETSIKVYIFIGIGGAAVIACVILFARGRRNIKSYILIIAIGGVLCAVTAFLDIETKDEHFAPTDSSSQSESIGQVTMSVDCLTIMGMRDDIPEDGYIIPVQTVDIKEGDTAFDLLDRLARENGILLDIKGSDEMIYVSGIAGIYEFDHGELSGWMYYVNGQAPSVNSSQYTPKDGDVIEWRYTKEIGRDIE